MPRNKQKVPDKPNDELAVAHFEDKEVRRHWDDDAEKWYLSIIDVVGAIVDSTVPKRYWADLKSKLKTEGFETYDNIVRLKMPAPDGKLRLTDCADVETMLRVVQSIPSPKAEPFKRWLAQVGYERIQETKDPEIAIQRAVGTYARKGYDDEWIGRRMRSIEVRNELTTEWRNRGIEDGLDYAILTNEVYKGWTGMTSKEYKHLKNLKDENLRDHMSPLELILNMLAEASTAEIARTTDAQGFEDNKKAATKGSGIAGNTRREIEQNTGKPVISEDNYLPPDDKKRLT